MICKSIPELIGNTPLLELGRFSADCGLEPPILAKLEAFNPAGSVKDRVENLIAVAHPDFRSELRKEAQRLELW